MADGCEDCGKGGAPTDSQDPTAHPCCTMENHFLLAERDEEYRDRRRAIERDTREWMDLYADESVRTDLIRIPVVVHIVLNPNIKEQAYEKDSTATEAAKKKAFEEEIKHQIELLSQDFRRQNESAKETPKEFVAHAVDARIEFALAARDPECKPTNGINWAPTSVEGWSAEAQGMKEKPNGVEPWDVTRYLNLWIVHYEGSAGGFGTPPGYPAKYQGITCTHQQIVPKPFSRVITHEVGHWLNLLHIWGDDQFEADQCQRDDEVADTPLQKIASHFMLPCKEHPTKSCTDADMFMNFMDYSPSVCMNLFTKGQAARMDAALSVSRPGILASDGLSPPPANPGPDLWMQDNAEDIGVEPDASAAPMCVSNDIWVRIANDGIKNQSHQNPEFDPPGGGSNFVYVRVRNRGCSGTGTGTLRVYWAKASSGLAWPEPWDGTVKTPILMGGEIGSAPVSIDAGEYEIFPFPWNPPNPDDYVGFGADKTHFCLLARIETQAAAPFGMTSRETRDLIANVRNNKKIVWKNVTVLGGTDGGDDRAQMIVANFTGEKRVETLRFDAVAVGGVSVFDWGRIVVTLPPALAEQLDEEETKGVEPLGEGRFEVFESGATIGRFVTLPDDLHVVEAAFEPRDRFDSLGARVFEFDAMQVADGETIGGVRFALKTQAPPVEQEPLDYLFDGVDWVPRDEVDASR